MSAARCYSRRLLQPFRGLAQTVEIGGADAVSRDGVHWELYIQGGVDREQDERGNWIEIPLSDIKFGSWSARDGLRRYPTRHVTDYARIDRLGTELLHAVQRAARALPLPPADHYECWLVDAAGAPVALIDSVCEVGDIDPGLGVEVGWRPGKLAQDEFEVAACAALRALIESVAVEARWFRRDRDGGHALRVGAGGVEESGFRAHAAFPELLLRERWDDAAAERLVAAFLDWQAPWLLGLAALSDATRRRLEAQAYRCAPRVADQHRSYPKVLDRDGLKATLVEAALRAALGEEPADEDRPLNFFESGN